MQSLKEAKKNGIPIYIPGGQVKGWEYAGDFVVNPDYVAPPPPPPVEKLKNICQDCRQEMPNKGRGLMRGMSVFYLCDNCIRKYGGA